MQIGWLIESQGFKTYLLNFLLDTKHIMPIVRPFACHWA